VATTDEAVIDSSMIIALVTPEKHSDWASQIIKKYTFFHILDLSYYEVANALRYKTSSNFTAKDAQTAWSQAAKLMNLCAHHTTTEVIENAFALASDVNITVYDAAFLSLADSIGIRFLSLDGKLAKKLEGTKYYKGTECPTDK
jgi:predicted nucleic acid-binding protein